ncbi:MAG: type II secretion system F family protein [Candidatus Tectomicrobia bacterium]|uniref:Type II secretion system F family protein n=1 Tax=Tectimicrobiota bacterium TaxID=2528274 RepID=A0A932CNJ3_UNCTE|nr:type II secretion system F family protein [Candidatus Tectomicrobia bacterium]
MPSFQWTGRTRAGAIQKGEIQAASIEAARAKLRNQQITASEIKPKEGASGPRGKGKVGERDMVIFTRQFSTMIDAGLPLVQCLDILGKQAPSKFFADTIFKIKSDVESGDTFADALRKHPRVFNDLYTNMVEAGETGGVLDTILRRLAGYMEKASALKKKIKSAMVYPSVILFVAIAVVVFLLVWVIPTFAKMFTEFGGTLPAPTRIVMGASDIARAYLPYIAVIVAVIVYLLRRYYRTSQGQRAVDAAMLKFPVFGSLIQRIAVAKFTRTLGTLLASGVPIIDALGITARTAGNKVVEEAVQAVISSIKEGKTIAAPLSQERVFPPMVVQMINVGEATGALDTMLNKIADFYDEEVDAAVEALTSLLEPMLMVFLGVVLGFVVVAMYMPIFQLAGTIG